MFIFGISFPFLSDYFSSAVWLPYCEARFLLRAQHCCSAKIAASQSREVQLIITHANWTLQWLVLISLCFIFFSFLPDIDEPSLNKEDVNLRTIPARKQLFTGKTFVFLTAKQVCYLFFCDYLISFPCCTNCYWHVDRYMIASLQ